MKKIGIDICNDLLDKVYYHVIKEIPYIENVGLYRGKMGVVLFLYYYSKHRKSKEAESLADNLIEDIWGNINNPELSFSFCSGYSGISWALFLLYRRRIIDIDPQDMREYINLVNKAFLYQTLVTPVAIDYECGIFTNGFFFISQDGMHDNLLQIYSFQEYVIYSICECERLIFEETTFNNLYLPETTLGLLDSMLYFLIYVHKKNFFPHKTEKLLVAIYQKIKDVLANFNLVDGVVTKQLFLLIKKELDIDFTFGEKHIDFDTQKIKSSSIEGIINNLSNAGLYSLFYNDALISKEVAEYIGIDDTQVLDGLEKELDVMIKNYDKQALNILLGFAQSIMMTLPNSKLSL